MSWLRVGDWIVSLSDVVAVHYDGGTVSLYTRDDRFQEKRGFSATGEEAARVWAYFCALSNDVMGEETLHKRVKRDDQDVNLSEGNGREEPREAPRGSHLTIR